MGISNRFLFYSFSYGTGVLWSSFVLVRVSFRILMSPRRFFLVKRRSVPPLALTQCLERVGGSLHSADRSVSNCMCSLSCHSIYFISIDTKSFADIYAQGLKLSYVAAGDTQKPLMLFLHGFPEFWYSWRHQIGHFADRYRCIMFSTCLLLHIFVFGYSGL